MKYITFRKFIFLVSLACMLLAPVTAQALKLSDRDYRISNQKQIAQYYYSVGNIDSAIEALKQLESLSPPDFTSQMSLGYLYHLNNDPESAYQAFDRVESKFKTGVEYKRALARTLVKLNMLEDALREYKWITKLVPTSKQDAKELEKVLDAIASGKDMSGETVLPDSYQQDDIYVNVEVENESPRVGQPVELSYVIETSISATMTGFTRDMHVKDHMVNLKAVDWKDDTKKSYQGPSFGAAPVWNEKEQKLMVTMITNGSAFTGIIELGDFILSIDGKEFDSTQSYMDYVYERKRDDLLVFKILRDGNVFDVEIAPNTCYHEGCVFDSEEYLSVGLTVECREKCLVTMSETDSISVGDEVMSVDGVEMNTQARWKRFNNALEAGRNYNVTFQNQSGVTETAQITAMAKKISVIEDQRGRKNTRIKSETIQKNGKPYLKAAINKMDLIFLEPGVYEIDPGKMKFSLNHWGLMEDIYFDFEPIQINVREAAKNNFS